MRGKAALLACCHSIHHLMPMLFKKPIRTRRSTSSRAKGNTLVVFPAGIPQITAAQREAMRRNAANPHLTRGFVETMTSDEEGPTLPLPMNTAD